MKNLRVLVGLGLNFLLYCLSYLIPKKRGSVLLGGGMGTKYSGNTKYLYLYLNQISNISPQPFSRFAWITKSRKLFAHLRSEKKPVYYGWSFSGFMAILRSEYLVVESGNAADIGGHDIAYERIFLGRFNIVQTWHGTPLKRICLDALQDRKLQRLYERAYYWLYKRELSSLRLILALSNIAKERFTSAFNNKNIEVTGYPKNDVFFGDCTRWEVETKWAKFDQVILYAPTFRDNQDAGTPFDLSFFSNLNEVLKARNWLFLVKKHQFDRLLQVPKGLSNISDVSNESEDVQELLVETDVLVTDYSSIFIDFLLKAKPVIFYVYDIDDYLAKSRQMYCEYFDEVPGPFAKDQKELLNLLMTCNEWFECPQYQARFRKSIDGYHEFRDGNSSLRLTNSILRLMKS